MFFQFLPILLASLITLVVINLLRPFAININLVDEPNDRKIHTGSVPLIGGIAMFIAIFISILVSPHDLNDFNYFLLSSFILIVIGAFDDHSNISVSPRLFIQALVALIIVLLGAIQITSLGSILGNGEILLNEWSGFISVIAIIAGINAVNMADGIHGLAGGNSLITFSAILFLSLGSVSLQDLWIVLLFCSALPVFLLHNLCLGIHKSKRIFMGDAGSMFIGMSLTWLLIDLSQGEFQVFNPITALWLFATPLIDMTASFIRRLLSGNSPFKGDLFHMHHLLLHQGIKDRNVLLIILLFSLLMAVVGVLGERYEIAEWVMFSGFLTVFVVYIIWSKWVIRKINNNTKLSD